MRWWGDHELPPGERAFFRIGALSLWVGRHQGEWRAAFEHGDDPTEEAIEVRVPAVEGVEPPETATIHRFATRSTENTLSLRPILADRSVVTRPEVPFTLLPEDEVEIFVSTAVWVHLSLAGDLAELVDVPTVRSSDTWFGPSTREGELAYASRTAARLNLENVARHPARAITGVTLRNLAEDNLLLERINLPVPALSLFRDGAGDLWTETITVERKRGGTMAEVRVGRTPPEAAAGAKQIGEARHPEARNVLSRALGSLLR